MKEMGKSKQTLKFNALGPVPGINVGDSFSYRSEIFVVGLHRAIQGGIAWIGKGEDKIASSVVASGGYEDDSDHGETLIYTGQGGNDYQGGKRQVKDQVATLGNLALLNSFLHKKPVRVIRGHSETPTTKLYTYDGLYKVVSKSHIAGTSGFKVFQFHLQRLPGQPPLKRRSVTFHVW